MPDLGQGTNPRQQSLLEFSLDFVLRQGDIMDKASLPPCKGWLLPIKNPSISNDPNIPASKYNNFHEERMPRTPLSPIKYLLQVISYISPPLDLQIIPYPTTKIAFKEQMSSILMGMQRTKDTL
jgi:hypothetical protein